MRGATRHVGPRRVFVDAIVCLAALCAACESTNSTKGDAGPIDSDAAAPRPDGFVVVSPVCDDGKDNDFDGLIDLDDPGCENGGDGDETDPPAPPQCDDGIDNDGDMLIDLDDPACSRPDDNDEAADPPPPPACADGVDNDQDGFIDYPTDPGCASPQDHDEDDRIDILPECGDGLDNDQDARIDLADPGCVSAADPRELDDMEPPACSDGIDNDEDGVIDFPLEVGCGSAGDDDETDPEDFIPRCANGRDDDGDARTDYPDDPGCAGVGDNDEADPDIVPACADGFDNDRDGHVDFPDDRGCSSAADNDEGGICGSQYRPVELESGRTIRGDNRGAPFTSEGSCGGRGAAEVLFVYRLERRVEMLVITTEHPETEIETAIYARRLCLEADSEIGCALEPIDDVAANRLELVDPVPGEIYIYVDGAGARSGRFFLTVAEIPLAECLNQIDDDGDGRIDYPNDPGCAARDDRSELDPPTPPQCADDEDNDNDALIDFPLDIGCLSAGDDDEFDTCGQGVHVYDYPVGESFIIGDTRDGGSNDFDGSCGGRNSVEKIYRYVNPINASIAFSVDNEETEQPTLLYVRTGACTDRNSEAACESGQQPDRKGRLGLEAAAPGELYVFVDHPNGIGGPFKLSVTVERLPAGCADGDDNDEDGFIDSDDPGCLDELDEDEVDAFGPESPPVCFDRDDNDGDGLADYPFDPGCWGKGDDDETDPDVPPACANHIDDDLDGEIDFPADPGCSHRADDDETNPRQRALCNNGRDDDGDGITDYPDDPGCVSQGDPSEIDEERPRDCGDGRDNDRDGLVDYPFDPGCLSAGWPVEDDADVAPICANGRDDDEDGIIDFPFDPGCRAAADSSEVDLARAPQCANGADDDRDGLTDFPDDVHCDSAADPTEAGGAAPRRDCADGLDNDGDGRVDLADIGCEGVGDDDEADPNPPPRCADGNDNDQDGDTDWPDDEGCEARGDRCEESDYSECDGVCVDTRTDPAHCGACGRVCRDDVECLGGRCGDIQPIVRLCGNTPVDAEPFIRGELALAGVRVERDSCQVDAQTQALLVTRGGVNTFDSDQVRTWVEAGGIVITEFSGTDEVYNRIFDLQVAEGPRFGSCTDNITPVVQFGPQDPFWQANEFISVPLNESGCGFSMQNWAGITRLGGWSDNSVSLAYRDLGLGRVWLVQSDWQDGQDSLSDASRDLMASMIAGGR